MRYTFLTLLVGFNVNLLAQDIKLMDYHAQYMNMKVTERRANEIRYSSNKTDTSQVSHAIFNSKGMPVRYTEYFARGRKLAEYTFEYGNDGRLKRHTVSTTFNDWQPVEFILTFDSKGRLISRELPQSIDNFWKKETFHYNQQNILARMEQWYEYNGTLVSQKQIDFPETLTPDVNSLTYIHDQNGLLLLHQFYNKLGKVDRCVKFEYAYR